MLRVMVALLAECDPVGHLAPLALWLRSFVYIFLLHFYTSPSLGNVSILKSNELKIKILSIFPWLFEYSASFYTYGARPRFETLGDFHRELA